MGLQCHIGSQITDIAPMGEAARALAALSRRLLDAGQALEILDLGGGLGVAYDGASRPCRPAPLAEQVLPALEGLPLTLVLEPGRSLVAAAGALLTRVLYLKEGRSRRFVIVDAGMNDLLRPALYQAHHRIEPVGPPRGGALEGRRGGARVRERRLPGQGSRAAEVAPGDLLAVRDAGAYAFAMASNYNLRPRPAEVLVEDGRVRLLRRRETFEDLVRTEVSAR